MSLEHKVLCFKCAFFKRIEGKPFCLKKNREIKVYKVKCKKYAPKSIGLMRFFQKEGGEGVDEG